MERQVLVKLPNTKFHENTSASYYYYYYYYHRISHFSALVGKYSPILGCSNQQD